MGVDSINNNRASIQTQPVMSAHIKPGTIEENSAQNGNGAVMRKTDEEIQTAAQASEKDTKYGGANDGQKKEKEIDADAIKKAVDNLNKKMQNTEAQYSVHEGTNRIIIKILDKNTKEVIKEITPEKMLDAIQNIWETVGLLIDEKS